MFMGKGKHIWLSRSEHLSWPDWGERTMLLGVIEEVVEVAVKKGKINRSTRSLFTDCL